MRRQVGRGGGAGGVDRGRRKEWSKFPRIQLFFFLIIKFDDGRQ